MSSSEGHTGPDAAGKVIEAFGEFVISGNYAVGLFVFLILIIINLVVVTKGAGRVSEVSARFTLDAMPGKQMAIDADLNAGVLTNEEAKARREEIAEEADFYGAMDGASKFVKGDAIASILILVINIVGGLIIGLAQHDLPVGEAAETYVLLSVGDGLVAQIPSLLLAISTAIIVTRVSKTHDMADNIGRQISLSRAWMPVSGVLLLIGFVPGMPNVMFLAAALVAAAAGYWAFTKERQRSAEAAGSEAAEEADEARPDQIELNEIADNAPISVQLGFALINLCGRGWQRRADQPDHRHSPPVSRALGFVIPPVRIRDDLALDGNSLPHLRRRHHRRRGQDLSRPQAGHRRRGGPREAERHRGEGSVLRHGCHLDHAQSEAEAEAHGYVVEPGIGSGDASVPDPAQIRQPADRPGRCPGAARQPAQTAPHLVESVLPKLVPLHNLTAILRVLLDERVPVSDLRSILEDMPPLAARNLGAIDAAEALRPRLAPLLIQQIAPLNQPLPVMTLDTELEHMLITMVRQSGEEGLILDNSLAEQLLRRFPRPRRR